MIQKLGKFTRYTPDDKNKIREIDGEPVLYLRDEKGNDWYDVIPLFDEYSTLKVGYYDDGRVGTFSTNIYAFAPENMSVVELPATEENMQVALGSEWFFKNGKLLRDYQLIAENERHKRIAEITERINWLAAAREDEDISAEEIAELEALRSYRSALRRLNLSHAADEASYNAIAWPEAPKAFRKIHNHERPSD